jgi:hypothetical protein
MGKKTALFWDVTSCKVCRSYQCFRRTCGLDIQSRLFQPEEGGRKYFRNIDGFLPKLHYVTSKKRVIFIVIAVRILDVTVNGEMGRLVNGWEEEWRN